jgi:tRNA-dihydrouridine synthase A
MNLFRPPYLLGSKLKKVASSTHGNNTYKCTRFMTHKPNKTPDLLSIAPMMYYTNKHQRTLMRFITQRAVLYTEMVVCNTLLHRANKERSLEADFSVEGPLVMQLGGSDPSSMHAATKVAMDYGYEDININVGCPSDKVSGAGCFGAVLMKSPRLVCDLALAAGDALGD